jgi:sulfoacetaldehyde dehydrogenase
MGCGSWGGNSIDGNLNWEHFVNRVRIVRVIEENKPELEDVLSEFWSASAK